MRFPRVASYDRILRPYNESEALGQFLLLEADDGAFSRDYYVGHVEVRSEGNVNCIVSTHRIVLVRIRDNKSVWQIPYSHFKAIKASYEGVTIYLQDEDLLERFLPLPDFETSNVSIAN